MKRNRRNPAIRFVPAAAMGIALLMPGVALAGQPGKEVATAIEHAGYAARSKNIKTVHMHLHHTLNCLVGPRGDGFDPHALDPCKGLGNGAIPDTRSVAIKKVLEAAVKEAQAGLKDDDLLSARKAASLTAAILKQKAS